MLREDPNRRESVGWLEDVYMDACMCVCMYCKYFVVKIFLNSLTCAKIKHAKIHVCAHY